MEKVVFTWGHNDHGQLGIGECDVSAWWVDASFKFGDAENKEEDGSAEHAGPAASTGKRTLSTDRAPSEHEHGGLPVVDATLMSATSLLDAVRKQVRFRQCSLTGAYHGGELRPFLQ